MGPELSLTPVFYEYQYFPAFSWLIISLRFIIFQSSVAKDDYALPDGAKQLLRRQADIRNTKIKTEDILTRFIDLKKRIPPIFMPLMEKHISKVTFCLKKGLLYVCWNSLIHERFFNEVDAALDELARIIDEVIDLKVNSDLWFLK